MKNKRFWSFLIFVLVGILLVGIIYSIANKEHQPSEILLTIDGYEMTLQEAVNNGFLSGSSPSQDYTTEADLIAGGVAYHTGDEIYVSVDGSEGTLNSLAGSGLCSSGASSYSGDLSVGHSGDEIYIDGVNTLQEAINNGDYCCVPKTCASLGKECGVYDNGCGGTVDCGDGLLWFIDSERHLFSCDDSGSCTDRGYKGIFAPYSSEAVYDGKLWFSSSRTLYSCDYSGNCESNGNFGDSKNGQIKYLVVYDNKLWLGFEDGDLFSCDKSLSCIDHGDKGEAILLIEVYNDKLWLGHEDGSLSSCNAEGICTDYGNKNIRYTNQFSYSAVYDNKLWLPTSNRLMSCNGSGECIVYGSVGGLIYGMEVYNDKLWIGYGDGYLASCDNEGNCEDKGQKGSWFMEIEEYNGKLWLAHVTGGLSSCDASGDCMFYDGDYAYSTEVFCGECFPNVSSACYGGDVYWYDSCNDRGEIKKSCDGASGCGSSTCFYDYYDWSGTCTDFCADKGLTDYANVGVRQSCVDGSTPPSSLACNTDVDFAFNVNVLENDQERECSTWSTSGSPTSCSYVATRCRCYG